MFDVPANTYLYHYTTLNTAKDFIVKDRTLRLGLLADMNDPRESKEWVFFPTDGYGGVTQKLTIDLMKQISAEIKRGCKILCLTSDIKSEDNYGRGYCLPRMWAQYADNHKGVCLVLDRKKLLETAKHVLSKKGMLRTGPIDYSAHLDHIPSFGVDMRRYEAGDHKKLWDDMIFKYYKHYFFKKNKDWRQEREYRILLRNDIHDREFLPIDGILKAVILGVDCTADYAMLKADLLQGSPIACYRMTWTNGYPAEEEVSD